MCGIVGSVGHQIETEQLERAVNSLRRRGPDGTGLFLDEVSPVALGHARLSIIDLQTGAQPLYSEENDIVLVCNGEIYEHERHRAELEARGHVFRTRSDSEVILHLYQEHGEAFAERLRGEFAFLLYDRAKQILFAVRDRFGVKPLFFNEQQGRYLFTSEAKAMFATGLLKPRISARAVRDFLSGVIPDSTFENVSVVPPGCFLKVSVNTRRHDVIPYWNLNLSIENESNETGNLEDAAKMVREALDEAISIRLRSDVPVGVYLSGGIDSSIVAATVARYCPGRLKVF
ncbi:MAG: asparagine synthase (glutamine-hydrolyzing), partial [Candidatus Hydrogenedentes bacterium]|nr:asparagine synthase (glutamine-hydrolyzing) [Candidatus Hydrogenedentota bacterium]